MYPSHPLILGFLDRTRRMILRRGEERYRIRTVPPALVPVTDDANARDRNSEETNAHTSKYPVQGGRDILAPYWGNNGETNGAFRLEYTLCIGAKGLQDGVSGYE